MIHRLMSLWLALEPVALFFFLRTRFFLPPARAFFAPFFSKDLAFSVLLYSLLRGALVKLPHMLDRCLWSSGFDFFFSLNLFLRQLYLDASPSVCTRALRSFHSHLRFSFGPVTPLAPSCFERMTKGPSPGSKHWLVRLSEHPITFGSQVRISPLRVFTCAYAMRCVCTGLFFIGFSPLC